MSNSDPKSHEKSHDFSMKQNIPECDSKRKNHSMMITCTDFNKNEELGNRSQNQGNESLKLEWKTEISTHCHKEFSTSKFFCL